MNHRDNHNSGNGFLLGLIVGGVATLLFTTKKGREIVKDLSDRGLERLSELQDAMEEAKKGYEDTENEDYIQLEPTIVKEEVAAIKKENSIPTPNPQKKSPKRFFKRTKKN